MCVTDHHDMTLAVKVALNPNTTNEPTNYFNTLHDKYTGSWVANRDSLTLVVTRRSIKIELQRSCINERFFTFDWKVSSNPLLHNDDFWRPSGKTLLKILW